MEGQSYQPSSYPPPQGTSYPPSCNGVAIVGPQYCAPHPMDLTVTEKGLSLTDGDYTVSDVNGNVVFRVKGKLLSLRDKRVIVDPAGNPLLTMRQKIMTMHNRWQAFRGDSSNINNLLFSAKRSSLIQFKTELDVFLATNTEEVVPDFKVKGSYFKRSCTIYNGDGSVILAQMFKRYTALNIVLGKDQFGVTIYPNVDYAFVVALIVVLDEINKDKDGRD